jgi:hypothetical protein
MNVPPMKTSTIIRQDGNGRYVVERRYNGLPWVVTNERPERHYRTLSAAQRRARRILRQAARTERANERRPIDRPNSGSTIRDALDRTE